MSNGPLHLDRAKPLSGDGMRTQRTLGEYPTETYVNLKCLKCPRTGRLRKDRLLAKYGPHMGLVNLINQLRPDDCPQNTVSPEGHNGCAICYGDLT